MECYNKRFLFIESRLSSFGLGVAWIPLFFAINAKSSALKRVGSRRAIWNGVYAEIVV